MPRRRASSDAAGAAGTSTSDVVVSAMVESDLDRVLEIEAHSFARPWTRQNFLYELRDNPVALNWVLRADDRVVAYVCAWLVVDELKLNNVAVDGAWRRRGIAKRLLERVFTAARSRGSRVATLEVRASNEGAQRLYRDLGFGVDARRDNYYPTDGEAAVLMSCKL